MSRPVIGRHDLIMTRSGEDSSWTKIVNESSPKTLIKSSRQSPSFRPSGAISSAGSHHRPSSYRSGRKQSKSLDRPIRSKESFGHSPNRISEDKALEGIFANIEQSELDDLKQMIEEQQKDFFNCLRLTPTQLSSEHDICRIGESRRINSKSIRDSPQRGELYSQRAYAPKKPIVLNEYYKSEPTTKFYQNNSTTTSNNNNNNNNNTTSLRHSAKSGLFPSNLSGFVNVNNDHTYPGGGGAGSGSGLKRSTSPFIAPSEASSTYVSDLTSNETTAPVPLDDEEDVRDTSSGGGIPMLPFASSQGPGPSCPLLVRDFLGRLQISSVESLSADVLKNAIDLLTEELQGREQQQQKQQQQQQQSQQQSPTATTTASGRGGGPSKSSSSSPPGLGLGPLGSSSTPKRQHIEHVFVAPSRRSQSQSQSQSSMYLGQSQSQSPRWSGPSSSSKAQQSQSQPQHSYQQQTISSAAHVVGRPDLRDPERDRTPKVKTTTGGKPNRTSPASPVNVCTKCDSMVDAHSDNNNMNTSMMYRKEKQRTTPTGEQQQQQQQMNHMEQRMRSSSSSPGSTVPSNLFSSGRVSSGNGGGDPWMGKSPSRSTSGSRSSSRPDSAKSSRPNSRTERSSSVSLSRGGASLDCASYFSSSSVDDEAKANANHSKNYDHHLRQTNALHKGPAKRRCKTPLAHSYRMRAHHNSTTSPPSPKGPDRYRSSHRYRSEAWGEVRNNNVKVNVTADTSYETASPSSDNKSSSSRYAKSDAVSSGPVSGERRNYISNTWSQSQCSESSSKSQSPFWRSPRSAFDDLSQSQSLTEGSSSSTSN
eukprot:gene9019-18678_t